jgi:poly(A) polymerase
MWDAIQEIRSSNDTSFDRWPPHINLLWPFIPQSQFASATTSIQSSSKFSSIQPFTVRLSRFSYTHGSRYIHLVADCVDPSSGSILPWPPVITKGKKKEIVSTPIQDLFVALMEVFPGCERPFLDENGLPSEWFLPHLSVGQVDQATIRETVASLQSGWTPIEFEVNELTFLARSGPNKPFQSILTVPLR